VSVIVPARDEEACIGACLKSLVEQTNLTLEIILVDDGSIDRTGEIARSFPGVQVIEAGAPPEGWIGKNHAVAAGAKIARGQWLLFTDADTVHLHGSLARSIAEAERNGAALLSYSPEQEVDGFWEKAIMPVIFAELAATYRPSDVSDQASPAAAANGQYILISRDAYNAVGGHAAVASDLLEDVALAKLVKSSGRKIIFRFGADAVRTRMYRSFAQLREGWTKNLALLFPSPAILAAVRLVEFTLIVAAVALTISASLRGRLGLSAIALLATVASYFILLRRIRKAHFSWDANLLALAGLPMFSYLLLRSRRAHQCGSVMWKARQYCTKSTGPSGSVVPNNTLNLEDEHGLSHAQS
jgi:glycosyltransferase involved in cell wall biosynthesis